MKHLIKIILLLIIVFLSNCNNQPQSRLEKALNLAGQNRGELENVLKRYSANSDDSLKYEATCFLIENMPGYYYYEGEGLDNYSNYYKWLDDKTKTPQQIQGKRM